MQELEEIIENLSSEQLKELQDIMKRDHDEMTEFDLISGELAEMGVEEEDIVDLKLLGSMMNDFVSSNLGSCRAYFNYKTSFLNMHSLKTM